ncbi:MAG: hypothetical protein DRQ02_08000 [Candidatus Latescibacterota bacterium]|nr:MAG: hypothetical protein DRQ02_08000 [Candidatus Latescibacterota bacterium]
MRRAWVIYKIQMFIEVIGVTGMVCGPTFQRLFSLSGTQLGILLSIGNIGVLVMSMLIGHATQRLGGYRTLQIGLGMLLLGLICVIFAHGFLPLLMGLAILGIAVAITVNANNTLLSEIFQERIRQVMALASGLWFTSSAVSVPLIGVWLEFCWNRGLESYSFRVPYLVGGIFIVVSLFSIRQFLAPLFKDISHSKVRQSPQEKCVYSHQKRKSRKWVLVIVLAVFHGFVMLSLYGWLNPMAQAKFGVGETGGSFLLACFCVGIASGRLIFSRVKLSWDNLNVLSMTGFLGGGFLCLGLISPSYIISCIFIAAGCFIYSAALPTILSIIGARFEAVKSKLFGYMEAGIAAAGLLGLPLIGTLLDSGVPHWKALLISPLSAWCLGLCSMVWKLTEKGEG